jgi:putative membrane protein
MADARERAGTSTLRAWVTIYLKGLFMGAADTVPGVSGGTIALITGIYERLVTAIANLDVDLAVQALSVRTSEDWHRFVGALRRADISFLVVLGFGVFTAILTVSRAVQLGLNDFRGPTNAFFFGLIAASAVVLYGEVALDSPRRWLAAIGSVGFAFVLTGATASGGLPHGVLVVFVAGAVTSSAMLLPGISGAALLYILGQYEFMVAALHGFIGALTRVDLATGMARGTVVITFLAGVGLGLLTIARAVRWALSRDRPTTLTALVSLMVGALRLPAQEVLADTAVWSPVSAGGVIGAAVVGAGLVLLLDRYTDDLEYGAAED